MRLIKVPQDVQYMKSSIFWDITPCSPLKVNRRFGGIYCLHLQGLKISQIKHQCEAGCKQSREIYLTCQAT
jgi:hypothetical protein